MKTAREIAHGIATAHAGRLPSNDWCAWTTSEHSSLCHALTAALVASQAENETTLRQHGDLCGQIEALKEELETHANQEVSWKLALDALKEELAEAEVTVGTLFMEKRDAAGALERARADVAQAREVAIALEAKVVRANLTIGFQRGMREKAEKHLGLVVGDLAERVALDMDHDNRDHSQWYAAVKRARAFLRPPTPIATPGTEPELTCGWCNGTGRERGLAGYYEPCRECANEANRAATIGTAPAQPLESWHEDDGAALWWKFPVVEPPYSGSPLSEDFPDYVTHWTRIVVPGEPAATPGTPTEEET